MTVTWDPISRSLHTTLSGGNLTVTGSINRTVGVAVDIPNKLIWFRNAQTQEWNASATANPATGTGGIAFTPASGLFPMASADTCTIVGLFNSGFAFPIPSGFSAWDTLAGSATTWNPSDKGANITLSGGNLIATCGVGYTAVRATNSLSSGKAYFEFTWTAITNYSVVGIGTSAAALNNYVGSTPAVSVGVHDNGNIYGASGLGDGSAYTTASAFYSSVLATQSRSSGKYYFEVLVAALETGSGFHLGLGDGNVVNFGNFSGSTTHGYSFNAQSSNNNVYYNNATVQSADAISHVGKTVGVAVDFGAALIWFWCNDGVNRWNASSTANPATGSGGFSIASLLGVSAAQFPVITPHSHDNSLSATTNFGATAFVNVLPSGFSSWDASQPVVTPAEVSKLNAYAVMINKSAQASKVNAYAVLYIPPVVPKGASALMVGV